MKYLKIIFFIWCCCASCTSNKKGLKHATANQKFIFSKQNLIPWSIVGFDVKERSPEQRLNMLTHLGFNQYAYGYRPKHLPTMKHEWELAKKKRDNNKSSLALYQSEKRSTRTVEKK